MKKILLSFSILICLTSCSSQSTLTKDKALELLKADFKNDCYARVLQRTLSHWTNHDDIMFGFQELEQSGLITIQQKQVSRGHFNTTTEFRWKPTQKADSEYKKQNWVYLASEVNILEIIGISINEETKTATARFKYENRPTPFHLIRDRERDCPEGIVDATATFRLYDTGWVLEQ